MRVLPPALLGAAVALACSGDSAGPSNGLARLEIALTPPDSTLMVNDTVRARVLGFDASGAAYPAGPVTWRSTNAAALSIDTLGFARATEPGSTLLIATVGSRADTVNVVIAGTRHSRPITANETWTLAGSPHDVSAQVVVGGAAAPVLTIEAGASVIFDDTVGLTIGLNGGGALSAAGTAALPITFQSARATRPAPGAWVGLTFRGHATSVLRHVVFNDCGSPRSDGEPVGCIVLGHPYQASSPSVLIDTVTVAFARGAALIAQGQSRVAAGSVALSVHDLHGPVATIMAGSAATFPAGGTLAADTNEIQLASDTLRASVVWANPGVPWRLLGQVVVEGFASPVLTIPGGSTVRANMDAGFVIGLHAAGGLQFGAAGAPRVRLTGGSGIAFLPFAVGSAIINADLDSCGGRGITGYGEGSVYLVGNFYGSAPAPVLQNVTITRAQSVGVGMIGGGRFGAGSNNVVITGTQSTFGVPLYVNQSPISSLPPGTYTGNGSDVVWVAAGDVTETQTWHNPGIPFSLPGLGVGGQLNPILTLDPGVVIRLRPGGWFAIGYPTPGGLHALGTAAAPIVLTSEYDFAGAWMGVYVGTLADSSTVFDHVTVVNAGATDGIYATAFRLERDLGGNIHNSLILQSAGCGITRMSGTTWSTDFTAPALGNSFQGNAGAPQCGP
jgi:hypothetical protein